MDTYPLNQGEAGSRVRIAWDDGTEFTKMASGTLRGYSDFDEPVATIEIVHPFVDETGRDAIIAVWAANRQTNVLVESDEGDLHAYFMNRPTVTDKEGGWFTVVSRLTGVLA